MLSPEERGALRQRILEYRTLFENNRGNSCHIEGLQLYQQYGGGLLCWVSGLSKIGLDNVSIGHLYFFPPDASDTDSALNVSDNGFHQYPPLSKREALEIGEPKDPVTFQKNFFFSLSRL